MNGPSRQGRDDQDQNPEENRGQAYKISPAGDSQTGLVSVGQRDNRIAKEENESRQGGTAYEEQRGELSPCQKSGLPAKNRVVNPFVVTWLRRGSFRIARFINRRQRGSMVASASRKGIEMFRRRWRRR